VILPEQQVFQTRNSAIADKPRDAFVQMQWRGWTKSTPLPICVTMPNLVVLR